MTTEKITDDEFCPICENEKWTSADHYHAAYPNQLIYAPPLAPAEYASRNNRLITCQRRVEEAPKVRNCRWLLKEKFEADRKILQACHSYKKSKVLWNKTRVCDACGTRFIRLIDFQSATPSFSIPEWPAGL